MIFLPWLKVALAYEPLLWKEWLNEEERAAQMGKSIGIFLPLGVEMDWRILWRTRVWSSSSWTSCLQLGAASMRRRARSWCSCSTSRPSPIRSCCRVPPRAPWTSPCRRVSMWWAGPGSRRCRYPFFRHLPPAFPQTVSSIISYLQTCKNVFVNCYGGLGKSN